MKKQLNLRLEEHVAMIQEVAFKSLSGIKVSEIKELRQLFNQDKHRYFNKIKLKYVILLGILGLEYSATDKVEGILFSYITHLITELPIENSSDDNEIYFN